MRRRVALSALAVFFTALFAVSVNATAAGADSSSSLKGETSVRLYGPYNNAD